MSGNRGRESCTRRRTCSRWALYAGSWVARGRGRTGLGRALSCTGLCAAAGGAFIGGHLAFRQATGANKAEQVPHLVAPGRHPLGRLEEFTVGKPTARRLGEVSLLVVRTGEIGLCMLADRCSHASGPLSEGTLTDGCVECPWHHSVFRLSDARNVSGPATAPQPTFRTRLRDHGAVEIRLPDAG